MILQACGSSTESNTSSSKSEDTKTEEAKGNDAASDYPERQIEIVLGFGAGGGSDNFARAIAKELTDILGVNINVVNMPGAAGIHAADHVARQPADGYTIWSMTSNYPINLASGKTPHDLSTYTSIGRVQHDTMTIQVLSDKFSDIDDFIAQAKEKPGEIRIGGTGSAGFDELVVSQFEEATGIELNYISFEGAGEMTAALLGGHIEAIAEELGPSIAHLQEGSVKMLIAFAENKLEGFEDVPLSTELGIDVTDGQNRGFMVHSDTPPEIIAILEKALEEAKDRPDYKEYEKSSFLHLRDGWLNSSDFDSQLATLVDKYGTILENLK
ncbi:tripartite tricarboxylate transporter substrate binding protein [bacterium LRH843]|nr:tripartite tricarboxylate transporter substrate binding protein [bacterium LRH843]